MPLFFQYLIKLSCSLSVVYLFYHLVLRKLTFYNSNRWYLLGFTLLSFIISAVNISDLVQQHEVTHSGVVQLIPTIYDYTAGAQILGQKAAPASISAWSVSLIVLALGTLLLFTRFMIRYGSYKKMRREAQLLSNDTIAIYKVTKPICPFSFGNAIFINPGQHSEAELQEIIRHEFVHVKQRHTLDIIWMELVCMFNWYNPFAWLLRHAVRQNLEFIADNHVIKSGVNKKEYQYLLLKVMGAPQFRIASAFNLSSLKKRIIMINKTPSAKAHLVKFLLAVPLVAVLLLAFRNGASKPGTGKENIVTASAHDINATTQAPIAGVVLHETYSNVSAITDARGFYSIAIPIKQQTQQADIWFRKNGHTSLHSNALITTKEQETATGTIEMMGSLKTKGSQQKYGVKAPAPDIFSNDRSQKNTFLKSPATTQAPADTTPYERKLQYLKEEIAHLKDSVQNIQYNEKAETETLLLQKDLAAIQQEQSEMQNDKIKNQAAIRIQQDKAERINIELKKEALDEQKKEVQLHEQKKQEIHNQQQKALELHAQKEQKKNIEVQKAQKIRLQKKQPVLQKKQPTQQH